MYCVLKILTESITKKYKNIRKSLISKIFFKFVLRFLKMDKCFVQILSKKNNLKTLLKIKKNLRESINSISKYMILLHCALNPFFSKYKRSNFNFGHFLEKILINPN